MYCLDTCICIDFLRGRTPELYNFLRETDPRLIIVPAVVVGELLVGAEKSNDSKKAKSTVEKFLLPFEIAPFNRMCADYYAQIRAHLEQRGCAIGGNDMLIAATALSRRAMLITNNVREFARISELSLETWSIMELDAMPDGPRSASNPGALRSASTF